MSEMTLNDLVVAAKSRVKNDDSPEILLELDEQLREAKAAFAMYMYTEGCKCCEDVEDHKKAELKLAEALNMDLTDDQSGVDYEKYLRDEDK